MSLVNNQAGVPSKVRSCQKFSEEHTIGHVLDYCGLASAIFESDGVPDFLAETDVHLIGNSSSDGHGSDTARLGAPYLTKFGVSYFMKELWYLCPGIGMKYELDLRLKFVLLDMR